MAETPDHRSPQARLSRDLRDITKHPPPQLGQYVPAFACRFSSIRAHKFLHPCAINVSHVNRPVRVNGNCVGALKLTVVVSEPPYSRNWPPVSTDHSPRRPVRWGGRLVTAIDNISDPVTIKRNCVWSTEERTLPLCEIASRAIKNLDARIFPVGHIDIASPVEGDPMRQIELTGPRPFRSPLEQKSSLGRELHNSRVSISVTHVKRPVMGDGHGCRSVEMLLIVASDTALTERKDQMPISGEFIDLLERRVSQPHVVIFIDSQPVRHSKLSGAPPRAHCTATRIENGNGWPRNRRLIEFI